MRGAGSISVLGEPFAVQKEAGFVYLVHRRWSMVACGRTQGDALRDLRGCARNVVAAFGPDAPEGLTMEARAMLAFSHRLLDHTPDSNTSPHTETET